MNELINGNAIKMTSIEIAELVGKRHDNVKRTIETLAKNGVIRLPQIEVSERINNLGFNVQYEHYVFEGEQGKRDSIVVVAQLSPEFTARLVDRWRELEEAAVNIPKTLPEALRLAADLAEKKMQLENQLAIAAPKVEFADRVGEASGILIGNFAKVVGIGPNKLIPKRRSANHSPTQVRHFHQITTPYQSHRRRSRLPPPRPRQHPERFTRFPYPRRICGRRRAIR